jgi:putative membrane-bound dehydrogenase-like protein
MGAMLAILPLLLAQNAAPDLTNRFDVPAGVQVTLWAQSPQLYNPTAIDVDGEGRLWVAEAVNYRQWNGRNPGRHHEAGDRIVVVVDTDADGVADSSTVFAQDPDLTAPLGIAVIGNEVYVSCSPHLFVYRDTDGDLKADEREIFLTGWGGHDHDHGFHSVISAPGGGLMWAAGNAGPHLVTGSDGWKLRSGSQYNGGGATNPGNRAGLKSDDGMVWTGGLVGRVGDDGANLRVLAHNFRNIYEVAADSFGEFYTADNDDDGNQACRTVAMIEGGDYGYFGHGGASTWNADRRPGQDTLTAHWHQDDPGVMPLGTGNGAGGPTGVAIYEDTLLPGLMGAVLNCDAGRSLVYAHVPEQRGAELHLQRNVLIRPSKENGGERGFWFRPSDVAVGPDGSIYVADWYDPGVGGHAAGDREAYGRILRLAPQLGTAYGMLNSGLDSPSVNVRGTAERALLADGDDIPPALPNDLRSLARRLFLKAQRPEERNEVRDALGHKDPRIRRAAFRALVQVEGPSVDLFARTVIDFDPRNRAIVTAALRTLPWDERGKILLAMARDPKAMDFLAKPAAERNSARILLESFGLAAHGNEEKLFAALMESGLSGDELLPFAWRLHPPSSLLWLTNYAQTPAADLTRRRAAIDAIAFQSTSAAADAMVALAHAGPEDTRGHAAWWVRSNTENRWAEFGLNDLFASDFEKAERLYEGAVLSAGSESIELDVAGVETLWLVVEDGGNGNSHDWAAFCDPKVTTTDGKSISLAEASWISAEAGWGQVRSNRDAMGGPIELDGVVIEHGIGTHAPSRIAFRLPKNAARFTCKVAPEDSGRLQPGAGTSLRFVIAAERPVDPAERLAAQQSALSGDTAALDKLLASTDGAIFLLEQARIGALSETLRANLASRLHGHADLSVRALASEVFPLTAADGSALPGLDQLAALQGSPEAGQGLFRGRGTCAVCHRFDGLGGAIGPDLSVIRDKFGTRELIDAMLNPSAAIAFGYDSWTLHLEDGRVLAGSILADGEQVVVRGLDGQRTVVPAAQISSRRKQTVSTMPQAHTLGLSAQDLADLAAFLDAEPEAEPRFGAAVPLFNGSDLSGWKTQLPAGADPSKVWSVTDGVLHCEGQPIGYLYTEAEYQDFELTLEWRFDPAAGAGNSGVLLRVQEPHKVWPRSIEAQLHSRNAGDIWNIDAVNMVIDADRTNGRRTVKMLPSNEKPLGEWNHYRIRVVGGDLELEVNGEVQNTATWVEIMAGPIALQSEGAVIEFRNIVLRPVLAD